MGGRSRNKPLDMLEVMFDDDFLDSVVCMAELDLLESYLKDELIELFKMEEKS